MKTKGELASEQLAGETFDCALPQNWIDHMVKVLELEPSVNVAGHFVWHYPSNNSLFGQPHALTLTGQQWLESIQ